MARFDQIDLSATYMAAERFVDVALRRDDSLFTPGRPIWSIATLEELDQRYVQAPDPGEGTFEDKLRIQIAGASADAVQLMGEVHFVYYLPASVDNISGDTKRRRIREVLSWGSPSVAMPDDLAAVLDQGIGGVGQGASTYKPANISYLVRFALAWKAMPEVERERALADPWAFKTFADSVPTTGGGTYAKEALLHLVHPDAFERMFSRNEKATLAQAFPTLVSDPSADIDRRLFEIRSHLAARFGTGFDFYWDVPVAAMWKPTLNRWASFLYWAGRLRSEPGFDGWERDYKLALVDLLTDARRAALAGDAGWRPALDKALRSRHNNLIGWRETDRFLKWIDGDPEAGLAALQHLWADDGNPLEGLSAFLDRVPRSAVSTPGQRTALGSVLLMATDPYRFPPYRPTPLQLAFKLTAFGASEEQEVPRYRQALAFFDAVLEHASSQGVALRDRLDAQSVTWAVTTYKTEDLPASWPEEDRVALTSYQRSAGAAPPEGDGPPESPVPGPEPTSDPLKALADELLLDEEDLAEMADLLEAKKQIVFYGPPGTGKTFVAKRLAEALAGDKERVRLVQFHANYAYEDFVEGYRPRLVDGHGTFELVPGPLRRVAAAAANDPAHRHVLIIDEMNRGNVAKVFGELYFLLEYRDEAIDLQYSPERFVMPANLRIIGTMNTADRSIALLDAALRRRFAFVPFFPDQPPIAGLLGRWLEHHVNEMRWVADVVDLANERLADRNGAIGPSFFLVAGLDEARLGLIWKHEIMPYLEDHFFDDPERLREFELTRLTAAARAPASSSPSDATDADDAAVAR